MTTFTQHVPLGATLRGCGPVTAGLLLRVHTAQPIGAPSLSGGFTLLSSGVAHAAVVDAHLGDDVSHNAYVDVSRALPKTGEDGTFEDVRASLVAAVGADARRLETVNRNLFSRSVWEPVGAHTKS